MSKNYSYQNMYFGVKNLKLFFRKYAKVENLFPPKKLFSIFWARGGGRLGKFFGPKIFLPTANNVS